MTVVRLEKDNLNGRAIRVYEDDGTYIRTACYLKDPLTITGWKGRYLVSSGNNHYVVDGVNEETVEATIRSKEPYHLLELAAAYTKYDDERSLRLLQQVYRLTEQEIMAFRNIMKKVNEKNGEGEVGSE